MPPIGMQAAINEPRVGGAIAVELFVTIRAPASRERRPMKPHDQLTIIRNRYRAGELRRFRDQVETYERTGGREANTLRDTGLPVIIVTTRGNKTGMVRKTRAVPGYLPSHEDLAWDQVPE